MKVEAMCEAEGCATAGTMQLVYCSKLDPRVTMAYDDEGNLLQCDYCTSYLRVKRLTSESAQFPLGTIHISEGAKRVLADETGDPLSYAKVAAEFMACHVRNEVNAAVTYEFGDATQLPTGEVITQHVFTGEYVWIITNKTRTETKIILAREYVAQ